MHILVVEDDTKIANVLRRGLLEERYAVDIAPDGEEALYKIDINSYDLIILDLMIPKIDGLTVCKKVRRNDSNIPILMLTARDRINDRVTGLDAGADDYLVKPFAFTELLARIRALLRRGREADPTVLTIDTLSLDPATQTVTRRNKEIELTAREYSLLEYFMRNKNRVLSRQQILEHVWDYSYEGLSNIVETYIKYVRRKIRLSESDPELIHTKRGSGYIMKVG